MDDPLQAFLEAAAKKPEPTRPGEIEPFQRAMAGALRDAEAAMESMASAYEAAIKSPTLRATVAEVADRLASATEDLRDLENQASRMRSIL